MIEIMGILNIFFFRGEMSVFVSKSLMSDFSFMFGNSRNAIEAWPASESDFKKVAP